jgi:hypothetical protein
VGHRFGRRTRVWRRIVLEYQSQDLDEPALPIFHEIEPPVPAFFPIRLPQPVEEGEVEELQDNLEESPEEPEAECLSPIRRSTVSSPSVTSPQAWIGLETGVDFGTQTVNVSTRDKWLQTETVRTPYGGQQSCGVQANVLLPNTSVATQIDISIQSVGT